MARPPFVGSAAAKLEALCSIGETAKVKTVPSRIEHIIFISNYKNYIIIRAWYCCGRWPNYMDKYLRTGTSAL